MPLRSLADELGLTRSSAASIGPISLNSPANTFFCISFAFCASNCFCTLCNSFILSKKVALGLRLSNCVSASSALKFLKLTASNSSANFSISFF